MAHFAQIDENNIVTQVIVVGNENCLDSDGNESEAVGIAFCKELLGADTNWVQTSYNDNIRHRYAMKGMEYDPEHDVFRNPQFYPSWILNTNIWDWEPPIPPPDDYGYDDEVNPTKFVEYAWDEESLSWIRGEVIDFTERPAFPPYRDCEDC